MSPKPAENQTLPVGSLAVAAFSTIVEWYDFTLYLYFATVLSRVFYGGGRGLAAADPRRLRHRLSDASARARSSSATSATGAAGGT